MSGFVPEISPTIHPSLLEKQFSPEPGRKAKRFTDSDSAAVRSTGSYPGTLTKSFELVARRGSEVNGICSNPFLEYAFQTTEYRIRVTINPDGTWSYELNTVLLLPDRPEPFQHTDRNTLHKIGEPTPNPTARAAS